MSGLDAALVVRAKRLLTHESASGDSSRECAVAAGRVYEKLNARLGPLLGAAGVQALFARSAKLANRALGAVGGGGVLEGPNSLCAFLQDLEPAVAHDAAVAFFGTFLSLITTFVGERLTLKALRGAWPTIDDSAPQGEQEMKESSERNGRGTEP